MFGIIFIFLFRYGFKFKYLGWILNKYLSVELMYEFYFRVNNNSILLVWLNFVR